MLEDILRKMCTSYRAIRFWHDTDVRPPWTSVSGPLRLLLSYTCHCNRAGKHARCTPDTYTLLTWIYIIATNQWTHIWFNMYIYNKIRKMIKIFQINIWDSICKFLRQCYEWCRKPGIGAIYPHWVTMVFARLLGNTFL